MPMDSAGSSRPKPDTAREVTERVAGWFVEIGAAVAKHAKYFLRPRRPASDEQYPKSTEEEEGEAVPVATAITDTTANSTTVESFTADETVDANVPVVADEEIQRRRNLVRLLFNDYWSGVNEKPAAFVERFDQAEDYLNERLAASGESWRLDAKTRTMLGLPLRSNSSDSGENHPVRR